MKYLKRFNEELKSSTYRSASAKLKQLGHVRRSGEIESYAKEIEERERQERINKRHKDIKSFPPFQLKWYKTKWDSSTKKTLEEPFTEGLFYIEPSFPYDWFGDMVWDYENDSKQYGLLLPLEFATVPADEETANSWKEIESKLSDESWDDIYWSMRLMVQVVVEGEANVTSNGKCFWEARESDLFVFANRSEAMRFKKLLIDALEGKNTWGKNEWYSEGMKSSFDKFFERDIKWRSDKKEKNQQVEEPTLTPDDMPKLISTIKTGLNINQLYRN